MKKFTILLWFSLMAFSVSSSFGCDSETSSIDTELKETLVKLKDQLTEREECLINKGFPDLPTNEDIKELEESLGFELPYQLREYHLNLGNLVFGGIQFPTVHANKDSGKSRLLSYIEDGKEKGLLRGNHEEWIPFASNNGVHYICMNKNTETVCYFSFLSRLEKERKEYLNFSEWLEETFDLQ